jgi:hypothetical protein
MNSKLSTIEKALQINLDNSIYGTIAEIGAGQEVARNFFLAGGAAGTIAKTMSAYDMQVSDAIYGQEKDKRYVSNSRVLKMLNREYDLVMNRLQHVRPINTRYFSFADTVVAKGYKTERLCHGWMGIKYQTNPEKPAGYIVLHVRMHDRSNIEQQQALGILGVNLIYAAFYYFNEPEKLIESLIDNLTNERIEIDMIKFDGEVFSAIDNRLMALHLVRSGLTHSVFFTKNGDPVQAYDLLYKKNVLLLRGSFRPYTNTHLDIHKCAKEEYLKLNSCLAGNFVFLAELSMSHLMTFGDLDKTDFLGRVNTLCAMGYHVQISDFNFFHRLKAYIKQFNLNHLAFVLGIKNISELFDSKTYGSNRENILYALAEIFSDNTQVFVYPKLLKNNVVRVVNEMDFKSDVKHLFKHFLINKSIIPIQGYDESKLPIFTKNIRKQIMDNNQEWKNLIPESVGEIIIRDKLFGLHE